MFHAVCKSSTLRFNASHDPSIPASGLVLRARVETPVTEDQARFLKTHRLVDVLEAPAPAPDRPPVAFGDAFTHSPEESSL